MLAALLVLSGGKAAAKSVPPTVMHIDNGATASLPASLQASHAGDGLAADSAGNLYVGYEGSNFLEYVAVFDGQGRFLRNWQVASGVHVPKVAVGGPDGLVYVLPGADPETIEIYKPDGTFVRQFGGGAISTDDGDIEVDPSGNVYVSSAAVTGQPDRFVVRFDPSGKVTQTWVPQPGGRANQAGAIAVAPDGSIYEVGLATVTVHSTLVHLAADGGVLSSKDLTQPLGEGTYKDVDYANGRLYLSGLFSTAAGPTHLHALAVLGPDETVQDQILGAGNKVAVSGTHVWVSGLDTNPANSRKAASSEFSIGGMDEVPIENKTGGKWADFLSGCSEISTAVTKEYGNIPTLILGSKQNPSCKAVFVDNESPCGAGTTPIPVQAYMGGKPIGVPRVSDPGKPFGKPIFNQAGVVLKGNDLQTGPIIFSWSCRDAANQEVEHHWEWKGSVYRLGDPSGAVYDSRTGRPVNAATVRLEFSSAPRGPFGAPLPLTALPQTNSEVTGVGGRFSWDVADGYWRLRASAVGYHSVTGKVYKVPPEVTGIRLVLRPDPAQQHFLIDPAGRVGKLKIGMRASSKLHVAGLRIRIVHGRIRSITVRSKRYQTAQRIKLGSKREDFESVYAVQVLRALPKAMKKAAPTVFHIKKAIFTVRGGVVGIKLGR